MPCRKLLLQWSFALLRPCAFVVCAILSAGTAGLSAQEKRFEDFSLKSLQSYPYKASPVTIEALAFKNSLQYAYNVRYTSMGLGVNARLALPAAGTIKGLVIMLRGHQNPGGYYTGKGTENPARVYLQQGYAVIAPDFLGYGGSSPTPAPAELHQFYSTINTVELYKSMETPDFRYAAAIPQEDRIALPGSFKKIALWGHSNGGQVAIQFLEMVRKPIPAVLWAPVSLAFPDSFAHYSRRSEWAAEFRKDHPAADFSLFTFLKNIAPGTPLLLEQGDKDTAVPRSWNDAFAKAVEEENTRRERAGTGKINLLYKVYPGANHNLNPYWSTILPGDTAFWDVLPAE